jgi:hypothetical protein
MNEDKPPQVSLQDEVTLQDNTHLFLRWVVTDPKNPERRFEYKDLNDFAKRLFELTDENEAIKFERDTLHKQLFHSKRENEVLRYKLNQKGGDL